jgi:branched-chain amino acid transport system substrate-binding protein
MQRTVTKQESTMTRLTRLPVLSALAVVLSFAVNSPVLAQVKIGVQAPLTGLAATDGRFVKIGAEIAVEEINAEGGVLGQRLELVIYDDQAKPDQAIFTANKLIGEGVKFAVSGSYSASGRAAAPVFQKAGVVFISAYSVHPDITKTGDYCFRLVHLGPPQGRAAAWFLAKKLQAKKISIIAMENDYGQTTTEGFLRGARDYGLDVIGKYTFSPQERQFGSVVAAIRRDSPDAIYISAYFFNGGPLIAQLRAAGIKAPIAGSQGIGNEKFFEIAGPAANGVYIFDIFEKDRLEPEFLNFKDEFIKRSGSEINVAAAETYTAIKLIADGIKRSNSIEPAKVRDALASTKNYKTWRGVIEGFSDRRELIFPFNVSQARDGKFVLDSMIADPDVTAATE